MVFEFKGQTIVFERERTKAKADDIMAKFTKAVTGRTFESPLELSAWAAGWWRRAALSIRS